MAKPAKHRLIRVMEMHKRWSPEYWKAYHKFRHHYGAEKLKQNREEMARKENEKIEKELFQHIMKELDAIIKLSA